MNKENTALVVGLLFEIVLIVLFTLIVHKLGLGWFWASIVGGLTAIAFTHFIGLVIGKGD